MPWPPRSPLGSPRGLGGWARAPRFRTATRPARSALGHRERVPVGHPCNRHGRAARRPRPNVLRACRVCRQHAGAAHGEHGVGRQGEHLGRNDDNRGANLRGGGRRVARFDHVGDKSHRQQDQSEYPCDEASCPQRHWQNSLHSSRHSRSNARAGANRRFGSASRAHYPVTGGHCDGLATVANEGVHMSEENLPFPVTMRGFDRDAVAAHIARLEADVASAKKAAADSAEKEKAATEVARGGQQGARRGGEAHLQGARRAGREPAALGRGAVLRRPRSRHDARAGHRCPRDRRRPAAARARRQRGGGDPCAEPSRGRRDQDAGGERGRRAQGGLRASGAEMLDRARREAERNAQNADAEIADKKATNDRELHTLRATTERETTEHLVTSQREAQERVETARAEAEQLVADATAAATQQRSEAEAILSAARAEAETPVLRNPGGGDAPRRRGRASALPTPPRAQRSSSPPRMPTRPTCRSFAEAEASDLRRRPSPRSPPCAPKLAEAATAAEEEIAEMRASAAAQVDQERAAHDASLKQERSATRRHRKRKGGIRGRHCAGAPGPRRQTRRERAEHDASISERAEHDTPCSGA